MEASVQIFSYVGSKARMAGVLSRLIPGHCTTYAELYCGSGALALNSRKFEVKILNDLIYIRVCVLGRVFRFNGKILI